MKGGNGRMLTLKKAGKTSVRVVEKCPDILVAVVRKWV
jgi:hypothetical protein